MINHGLSGVAQKHCSHFQSPLPGKNFSPRPFPLSPAAARQPTEFSKLAPHMRIQSLLLIEDHQQTAVNLAESTRLILLNHIVCYVPFQFSSSLPNHRCVRQIIMETPQRFLPYQHPRSTSSAQITQIRSRLATLFYRETLGCP